MKKIMIKAAIWFGVILLGIAFLISYLNLYEKHTQSLKCQLVSMIGKTPSEVTEKFGEFTWSEFNSDGEWHCGDCIQAEYLVEVLPNGDYLLADCFFLVLERGNTESSVLELVRFSVLDMTKDE